MNKVQISQSLARRIVLDAQLLNGRAELSKGKKGLVQTIDQLGYVQIDTISVIKRSHHHTLWTRRHDYDEKMLHELQSKDRIIFEYWGHAMSYLPMADYRYFLPRMRNFENPTSRWAQLQLQKCNHLLQPVLERIRNEGPLSSKDFSSSSGKKGGTWWDWKPAKVALELLFWKGDLMITKRHNFQKVYDLTGRVIPDDIDTTMPDIEELGQFLVRRALTAFGAANEREIQKFMQPDSARDSDLQIASKEVISKTLNNLVEAKEVSPVMLKEDHNSSYYALSEVIENSNMLEQAGSQVFLLSPFDNLIIQRERTKKLFGFDYALECYVPAAKRRFGYFVLPILWGENFVGRLDPKADRKKKRLIISNLSFESQIKSWEKFLPLFADKLVNFARFNDCEKIVFEKISPGKIRAALESFVKKKV